MPRPEWDHEHCSFCWAKFVEAGAYPRYVERGQAEDVYTEGYTTTEDYEHGADY